jgi:putative nucleotidyltransferase with HDIG domain
MDDFTMYENIRRHSFMVARVAELLVRGLRDEGSSGPVPDKDLVIAGALLHDIAKTKCLRENCRHAEVGAEICMDLGYPEIAGIVADHVILSRFEEERYHRGVFTATELVFYADKRVRHDEVVSLDARLEYILGKYGNGTPLHEALILKNFNLCRELENHLFARLRFSPSDIDTLLVSALPELHHYPPAVS